MRYLHSKGVDCRRGVRVQHDGECPSPCSKYGLSSNRAARITSHAANMDYPPTQWPASPRCFGASARTQHKNGPHSPRAAMAGAATSEETPWDAAVKAKNEDVVKFLNDP